MANNQLLKDAIAAVIKANGNNEITGQVMQDSLIAIINQFGLGGVFAGIATPTTVPVNGDVVAFYIATTNGVYANFGGYTLRDNDFVIFSNKSGVYQVVAELNVSGITYLIPTAPGTIANRAVLPVMKAGNRYVFEAAPGYYTFNGVNYDALPNKRWLFVGDGTTWTLNDMGNLFSGIPSWSAAEYTGITQVNHKGRDWVLPAGVVASATEIPGESPKWIDRLQAYAAASTMFFINNTVGKWGVLDANFQILVMVDKEDKLDALGLSQRLYDAIKTSISPSMADSILATVKSDLGIQKIFNSKYVWGVLGPNLEVYIGITKAGKIEGDLAGLEPIQAQMAALAEQVARGGSNKIIFWGDSLTAAATYPNVVMALAGANYVGVNAGVGGESVPGIVARQGAIPARITEAFVLPADLTPVVISNASSNVRLKNKYNKNITPLLQGQGITVNPCYVQGVECTLAWTGAAYNDPAGTYTLRRNVAAASPLNVEANTFMFMQGAYAYRKVAAASYYMGQNLGYDSPAQLVEYIRACVEFNGCENYIVIGLHTGTPAARAELELLCANEFGFRYINLRKHMLAQAFVDMGMTPTAEDAPYIAAGTFPPSWWSTPTDPVHMNNLGYTALGRVAYNTMKQLGFFKTT
jgi:hypothetical protein